jgi:hypothetical protein
MKKYIAVLVACLGLTALGLQTAQAAPETTASHQSVQTVQSVQQVQTVRTVQAPSVWDSPRAVLGAQTTQATQYAPWHIYNGHKWTIYEAPQVPNLCILDGIGAPSAYPVGVAAQAWNNASSGVSITVSNRCTGYGPGVRATVDTYSALDGNCVRMIGASWTTIPTGSTDGFRTWTNTPVGEVQVNQNYNCNSTGFRRAHWISVAIGEILGLRMMNSSETSFSNRVMWVGSQDTIQYAETYSGSAVTQLYNGSWLGPCTGAAPGSPCGNGTTYINTGMLP